MVVKTAQKPAAANEPPEDKASQAGLAQFKVALPAREVNDLQVNRAGLEKLAAATGGAYRGVGQLADVEKLAASIPQGGRPLQPHAEGHEPGLGNQGQAGRTGLIADLGGGVVIIHAGAG